ncbi:MAG: hypothetical protein Q8Q51_11510 [Lutibacter sp.]|nr:hypothetical protein [Lutibacter sp.]
MKHLKFIKFVIGLFLLSLPVISGLLFFYSLIIEKWVPLFQTITDTRLLTHSPMILPNTLIFISVCGFTGAYLLNSIKNK